MQLSTLLDKLRMAELVTSDSGAISDYSQSENTELDCRKSHSSTSLTFNLEERESVNVCSKQSDLCGSVAHHITTGILTITPENSEQNTTTQPVTGAVDDVVKDVNVSREAQSERGKCCKDKDKETTKQTSTLANSLSSHYTEEVAWGKEEEKDLTQSHEHCKALKIVGNQEKRERLEKRGVSETAHTHSSAAQQTERYYCGHHSYSRRNCGYHGCGRNSSQQSNTSTRDVTNSNSCSSFNHDEVAEFLWKSMFANVLCIVHE